jgi:hypothetical protein
LELLDSPRPEAHTTAAWGLCQLRVAATAEPILEVFEAKTKHWIAYVSHQAVTEPVAGTEIQLAHLAQALGRLKHAPADRVLREYIPKFSPLPMVSRAAGVWALGHLWAENPDAELAELLKDRLIDVNPPIHERPLVRRMAAVSLARMRATDHLPSLRAMLARDTVQVDVGIACAWAIEQLTGEPIPEIRPEIVRDRWFLVPIE